MDTADVVCSAESYTTEPLVGGGHSRLWSLYSTNKRTKYR